MLATVFETSSEAVKVSIIGKSLSIKPLMNDLKVPTHIMGHAKLGHANSHSVTACTVRISVHSPVYSPVREFSPRV